jgi:hypothetical protein
MFSNLDLAFFEPNLIFLQCLLSHNFNLTGLGSKLFHSGDNITVFKVINLFKFTLQCLN